VNGTNSSVPDLVHARCLNHFVFDNRRVVLPWSFAALVGPTIVPPCPAKPRRDYPIPQVKACASRKLRENLCTRELATPVVNSDAGAAARIAAASVVPNAVTTDTAADSVVELGNVRAAMNFQQSQDRQNQ
jgi:hypothetical protein